MSGACVVAGVVTGVVGSEPPPSELLKMTTSKMMIATTTATTARMIPNEDPLDWLTVTAGCCAGGQEVAGSNPASPTERTRLEPVVRSLVTVGGHSPSLG